MSNTPRGHPPRQFGCDMANEWGSRLGWLPSGLSAAPEWSRAVCVTDDKPTRDPSLCHVGASMVGAGEEEGKILLFDKRSFGT